MSGTAAASGGSMPSGNQGGQCNHESPDSADKNYMAAIHALMVAMAKQNSIQIPAEALPARPRITDKIDPGRWRYESEKTINYQLQQRPIAEACSSEEWKQIFERFCSTGLTIARRDHPLSTDLVNILSWTVPQPKDLHPAQVDYDEFSYDEGGYVCRLRQEDLATTNASDPPRKPSETSPGSHGRVISEYMVTQPTTDESPIGQRFGREWKFRLNGLSDNMLFSIAAAQLCRAADCHDEDLAKTGKYNPLGSARQRLAKCFLTQFGDTWAQSQNLWGTSDHRWTGSAKFNKSSWEDLVFQYHMRAFIALPLERPWERRLGPGLIRESGTLRDEKNARNLGILEVRYSVGLKTTWRLDFPVFSLITMTDTTESLQGCGNLWGRNEWETAGIHPSVRATGTAAFAFRIQSLLPEWEAHWSRLIDNIGKLPNANLSSVLSQTHWHETMVDAADLGLPSFYSAVIQILRISADWIQESMDDLRQTVDDMERLYLASTADGQFATFLPPESKARDAATKVFKQNWESVILQQQRLGNALLVRIAKKMEETKSLRDSFFNATTVSEARKSTQVNHYILVFTVVTVFYLPLSFVAVHPRQTTWFIITITLVSGVTYLVSWLSMWVIGNPTRRRSFADAYARLNLRALVEWVPRLPKGGKEGESLSPSC
ncbi:hypothetical protein B0T25DRAFT_491624 [Lasiosphaeria hispida]|uniref:Uncharacterized protein n=1 Tax=Lasiosphaeria hispida TaxID=260671 RepID=A0AAJ0HUW1_9PEZI|nr:hypothetical protein B0T25DRAFT_491624 [Lasiosphaeria hispida]